MSLPSVYAIRALTYLASRPPGQLSGTREIAEHEDIPEAFLGKVLVQLRRGRLVRSYRGVGGGYELAAPPEKINLLSILQCIEGQGVMKTCALEDRQCTPERPCALHQEWAPIQQRMLEFLERSTVEGLARARQAPVEAGPTDEQVGRSTDPVKEL